MYFDFVCIFMVFTMFVIITIIFQLLEILNFDIYRYVRLYGAM